MKITENAINEIKNVLVLQGMSIDSTYLRLGIAGKNCSGPVYSFGLDQNFDAEMDEILDYNGIKVVNQKSFSEDLNPVVVDYVELNGQKGFTLINPLSLTKGDCNDGKCCGGGSCSK